MIKLNPLSFMLKVRLLGVSFLDLKLFLILFLERFTSSISSSMDDGQVGQPNVVTHQYSLRVLCNAFDRNRLNCCPINIPESADKPAPINGTIEYPEDRVFDISFRN